MNDNLLKTHLIKRFSIKELFGSYTYTLDVPETSHLESENLFLLYGDNGAGKTTILNLIYHLLNPEPYDGHRTYVGRTPFQHIEITLTSGTSISASREVASTGKYLLKIDNAPSSNSIEWHWIPDKNKSKGEEDIEYLSLCKILSELDISFHYLRDSRRVEGITSPSKEDRMKRLVYSMSSDIRYSEDDDDEEVISPNRLLRRSIKEIVQDSKAMCQTGCRLSG